MAIVVYRCTEGDLSADQRGRLRGFQPVEQGASLVYYFDTEIVRCCEACRIPLRQSELAICERCAEAPQG